MGNGALAAEPAKASDEPSAKANQQVVTTIAPEQIVKILADEGFATAAVGKDGEVKVKMNGYTVYYALNEERTVIRAQFAVKSEDVSIGKINNWNRTRRFSRAHLDEDFWPVLESELMVCDGVTAETVKTFVLGFEFSQRTFIKEVLD
jgi:hypothetical protein